MIGDSYPLSNITDILNQLRNAKYFSTLDLASDYHQIAMDEKDKNKTAFSTSYEHYEFNRMPFRAEERAGHLSMINERSSGIQGIRCLVYLDDIVIYGSSLQEHNKRLTEILQRLHEHLKLQVEKCEFLCKEVTYLGHIISKDGISPDPAKLSAVKDFPTPKKVKDVQSFIELAGYYRKFIKNVSKIAKLLTMLTKKDNKFNWSTEQQNAFNILKEKLIFAPVLNYLDFSQQFLITTDASDYRIAIEAILSQGPVSQDQPIAYASRILNKAEQNYTTEKELLAIVWAVKYFRPYVYGTKFLITDYKSLTWLFSVNDPGSRLIRWRLKLEEYDYEIIHRTGKGNKER